MAQQVELEIAPREVMGKANKKLRKSGFIPANISGHNEPPQAVQVNAVLLERLQRARHATSVLALKMPDGPTQTALIRHVQHAPKSGKILHIDFFRVNLNERIAVRVALNFVGESLAVKNEGGVLLHLLDTLEVECLASDIVEGLDVDISPLTEIDATLHVSDVKLPANFTLITDSNEPIAKVGATRAEVSEEAAEAEATPENAGAAPEDKNEA